MFMKSLHAQNIFYFIERRFLSQNYKFSNKNDFLANQDL